MTRALPKALTIAELKKQLAQQKKKVADLKNSLSNKDATIKQDQGGLSGTINELKNSLTETGTELETAKKAMTTLQAQYDTLLKNSGDVTTIVNERENLQKENEHLTDELNSLREENAFLLRTAVIKWFLAGAAVLLVGWMVGKSSRRKRRY